MASPGEHQQRGDEPQDGGDTGRKSEVVGELPGMCSALGGSAERRAQREGGLKCRHDEDAARQREGHSVADEQRVVAHEAQEDRGDRRAGEVLELVGDARQRQGLRVAGLVLEDLRDERLEGGGERGRARAQDEDEDVDLPGGGDERQREDDDQACEIQSDQQLSPAEALRVGRRQRRDADVGDHLRRQGDADDDAGVLPREIVGEQAEGHRRQAGPDQ